MSHFWPGQGQPYCLPCSEHQWFETPFVSNLAWGHTCKPPWLPHQKAELIHQTEVPRGTKRGMSVKRLQNVGGACNFGLMIMLIWIRKVSGTGDGQCGSTGLTLQGKTSQSLFFYSMTCDLIKPRLYWRSSGLCTIQKSSFFQEA